MAGRAAGTNQRAELHKTIWAIANDLRGSVDGWDFKQYVLGILFYRFLSENICEHVAQVEGPDVSYAELADEVALRARASLVEQRGFFILPSELFQNVCRTAEHDENLNETLERIFKNIEASAAGTESEEDLRGLFDDVNVNSAKLGNTVAERNRKLSLLLQKVAGLDFGGAFYNNSIDAFGDAYEYLMTMYASSAGKSGGEFFTPQEVSELLARITLVGKSQVRTVYDPCCGSGSLLLRFAKILGAQNVTGGFYGQEVNLTTYNLCRINMFLHNISFDRFHIALGDTLGQPAHARPEGFECIVSNPPYSVRWEGKTNPLLMNDERFSPAGVLAPPSKADLAFTMHMLSWLATDGTAAIIEFPGVLYRGKAEAKIRRYLVQENFVDAVVQLPADLFFGTTIATCVIVLRKSKATSDVLFVDASGEFERRDTKNHLTEANIGRIMGAIEARAEEGHFSAVVPNDAILDNDANLSVSSYVERTCEREQIDIAQLNASIAQIVAREDELRRQIDAIVAELEGGA